MRESIYILISNIYAKGMAYLFYFLTSFFLKTESFGILRGLLPILDTLTIIFSSGIPVSIAKFSAEGKKVNISILIFMFFLSIIGVLVVLNIKYILGGHYLKLNNLFYIILGVCILFSPIVSFVRGTLQGNFRFKELALTWIVESTLKIIFLIILINIIKIFGAFLALALSSLTTGLIFFIYIRKYIDFSFNFNYIKNIFFYSIPISLTSSAYRIFGDIDNIIIMSFLGPYWSGIYGYSALLSRGIIMFSTSISIPLLPKIAKNKDIRDLYKSVIFNTLLSLPVVILFILFSDFFLHLFFGVDNPDGSLSLKILSISSLFMGYFYIISSTLQGLGYANISFYIIIFGISLNILLNIILIKNFGIVGGSIATLTSAVLIVILGLFTIIKLKC